jgi:hypothetical protein
LTWTEKERNKHLRDQNHCKEWFMKYGILIKSKNYLWVFTEGTIYQVVILVQGVSWGTRASTYLVLPHSLFLLHATLAGFVNFCQNYWTLGLTRNVLDHKQTFLASYQPKSLEKSACVRTKYGSREKKKVNPASCHIHMFLFL